MGLANIDFVLRENRAVVDGEMAVLRLGTCGALQPPARLGSFVVADPGSILIRWAGGGAEREQRGGGCHAGSGCLLPCALCMLHVHAAGLNSHLPPSRYTPTATLPLSTLPRRRNPDAFSPEGEAAGLTPYSFSRPIPSDPQLSAALAAEAAAWLGTEGVCAGLNATADSFYSSQGRRSSWFQDRNDSLLSDLLRCYPDTVTLEMETAQLLDLARCSGGSLRAAAGVIVLADRASNDFLGAQRIEQLERAAGQACLAALAATQLDDMWGPASNGSTPVWLA